MELGCICELVIFALGNRTYLAFLNLIPVFNLFWIFWTAAHAKQWALDVNKYNSPEEFRKVMNTWNRGGFILFIINIVAYTILFMFWFAIRTSIVAQYNG